MNEKRKAIAQKVFCACGKKLRWITDGGDGFNPDNLYFEPCPNCIDKQYHEGEKDGYNMGFIEGMTDENDYTKQPVDPGEPEEEEREATEEELAELKAEWEARDLGTYADPLNYDVDARTFCHCGIRLKRNKDKLPKEADPANYYFEPCEDCVAEWNRYGYEDEFWMGYSSGLLENKKFKKES